MKYKWLPIFDVKSCSGCRACTSYCASGSLTIVDGVVRNLEIVGEAVKNIPANVKDKHPDIEWKKIAGLRDILAHEYFGIDIDILWDIVENKLPDLKKDISRLLKK